VDPAQRASPLHRDDFTRLGTYRLVGRLGAGGMGIVYLGLDATGRYVAIKLVHSALADNPVFRARFRSEVERARQVPAFCTAEVLDADLDHEPPYLVVEYVDGPSLAEVVAERGPLSSSHLHSVAVGVATALTGIHGAGVIHRDLKPENVLLAPGSPKVIDFGIARAFEATSQHTRTGQMVGTVSYMAPERFSARPDTALTAAADIFAWGCVIAFAGTGHTPFQGDSPEATAARILTQPPYLEGLSEPLRGFIESAIVKDPAARPTARELLDLLVGGLTPAGSRAPRPRPAGLSPAVAAFLTPIDSPQSPPSPPAPARPVSSRAGAVRSGGLRPEVAAFIEQSAPRVGEPGSAAASRPATARPAGLRRGLADFIEPADPVPAGRPGPARSSQNGSRWHSPTHGTPGGASPLDRLRTWATAQARTVRGGRWLARSTALLVVAGIIVVIGAGVWLGRSLTSGTDQDANTGALGTLSAPGGSGAPSAPAEIAEPTGGTVVVQDPLTRPGRWPDTALGRRGARCHTNGGVLRAERIDRVEPGDFRCPGPADEIGGDVGVEVTTTLQQPSSCAAIWFHVDGAGGGQVLRVCETGITISDDLPGDRQVLGTFGQARPIALRTKTRIHLVVRGHTATLWQDDQLAGSVQLPVTGAAGGQALLGISVQNGDDNPPYSVTFSDVDIRSF
jgi:eukaryotic-like serine/threonine-protein kinase